jgi:hypothetical protein
LCCQHSFFVALQQRVNKHVELEVLS